MMFTIPFKTPTVNHLYGNWRGRVVLKTTAKILREKIFALVDDLDKKEINKLKDQELLVCVWVHENWYTKKGTVAKKDVANREKFLIDSVFKALDLDDKMIFSHSMMKVQDTKEYASVCITKR